MDSNRFSFTPSLYSSTSPSVDTTHSSLHQRSTPSTPSYMNAAVPPQYQTPTHALSHTIPRTPVASKPAPAAARGVLILAIAAAPAKELKTYVEVLLTRSPAAEVAILGLEEYGSTLKQLKMDIYGLAGRLRLELGVQLFLRDEWSAGALEDAMKEALWREKAGAQGHSANGMVNNHVKDIKGIICSPQVVYGVDLLRIETQDLARSWQASVGFLHATAKCSISRMASGTHAGSAKNRLQGPFIFTTHSVSTATNGAQSIHQPSMDALMDSLENLYSASGIAFGYAERELKPEPDVESVQRLSMNGSGKLSVDTYSNGDYYVDDDAGDSPTKLWGMWANANID